MPKKELPSQTQPVLHAVQGMGRALDGAVRTRTRTVRLGVSPIRPIDRIRREPDPSRIVVCIYRSQYSVRIRCCTRTRVVATRKSTSSDTVRYIFLRRQPEPSTQAPKDDLPEQFAT
eukprot:scaffold131474_cov20-Prasinocladus_malaysianus.AAC.1